MTCRDILRNKIMSVHMSCERMHAITCGRCLLPKKALASEVLDSLASVVIGDLNLNSMQAHKKQAFKDVDIEGNFVFE